MKKRFRVGQINEDIVLSFTVELLPLLLCETLQVKLLLDWEQTYINYRSLELPATVSPSHGRGETGGSQLWRWLVDTVFTLEDDLYNISTVKKLLFPEEVCHYSLSVTTTVPFFFTFLVQTLPVYA